jgi:dTDP-4-dehydrorhamnose reductase/dTDP-4-dehydrorhamnose 3,5-epimerase-like enzyme
MTQTIKYNRKCDWWNGKVLIDELNIFADDRGMVSETFRTDDTDLIESKMCYISETKPFVLRGPHEHETQKDSFVSWKTCMVYQMYNKETKEMKWFVTDPAKITRVVVAIGIVHSYRNISLEDAKTLNFPDQLFMGENKQGYKPGVKIDEIRHEETIAPSKTIWVLGANGRLGKALTDQLFTDMGYHSYHVVPLYENITNDKDGMTKLSKILDTILKNKKDDDLVINCISKTNVQDTKCSDFKFVNFFLPKYLSEFAIKTHTKLVHFSTDYVYQQGKVSEYTKSKKAWEEWFNEQLSQIFADVDATQTDLHTYVKVVRLANLFSQDELDVHNALNKLWNRFVEGKVYSPEDLKIMPTDVNDIAIWLSEEYVHNIEKYNQFVNISGKPYTFSEIYSFSGLPNELEVLPVGDPETINNPDVFLNNPSYVELNCDVAIKRKFDTIRATSNK